jgi:hypothetical protein
MNETERKEKAERLLTALNSNPGRFMTKDRWVLTEINTGYVDFTLTYPTGGLQLPPGKTVSSHFYPHMLGHVAEESWVFKSLGHEVYYIEGLHLKGFGYVLMNLENQGSQNKLIMRVFPSPFLHATSACRDTHLQTLQAFEFDEQGKVISQPDPDAYKEALQYFQKNS